ncbi:MAG: Rpn family recombination-promoting nuclease/putative transposase [Planctomycetes bacterium]|nr:Rpn family recombination-promoting nuclease/putative transposase [Planctomycetota bacterium]
MAYDPDMHELATRYPDAVLALLGCRARGAYVVEAIDVKRSEHRIDLVFLPGDARDPTIYVEWQMYASEEAERGLLAEVVEHCDQTGRFEPVDVAIVYPDRATRDRALPADVGHAGRRAVSFTPLRVVLTEVEPELLLAAGGPALVALPLVGPEEQVRWHAREWLALACAQADDREGAARAKDLFLKLLAWRLGTISIEELEGLEGVMEETATGQALLRRGEERGEARGRAEGEAKGRAEECRRAIALVISTRFGAVPDWLSERLAGEVDLARLEDLLRAAVVAEQVTALRDAP